MDVTASAETVRHLLTARREGWGLLLANKNPLVESQAVWDELTNGPLGFSATVGAGLPVIPEILKLQAEGHRILRLEACLSGSLGVLASELDQGRSFSSTMLAAIQQGFTEPDPRVDLSGSDVAKKILILARLSGYRLEFKDVKRTALFPEPMAEISRDDFVNQLPMLDPVLDRRIRLAHSQEHVLRFVASMEAGTCRVSFQPVHRDSPLGQLTGDQKRILIYTDQLDEPVIITGAGSGPKDTARDLIKDLLSLDL